MEEVVSNKNLSSTAIANIVREAWLEFRESATVSKIQTNIEKVLLAPEVGLPQETFYDPHRIFLSLLLCIDKTTNLEFGINVYATEQTVLEKAVWLFSTLTERLPKLKQNFDHVKAVLMVQAVFACCRNGNWDAARTISDRLKIHEFYKDYPGSIWHITSQLVVKEVLKEYDMHHPLLCAKRFDYALFLKFDLIPLLERVYNTISETVRAGIKPDFVLKVEALSCEENANILKCNSNKKNIADGSSDARIPNSTPKSVFEVLENETMFPGSPEANNVVWGKSSYLQNSLKQEDLDNTILENNGIIFGDGSPDLQLSTVEVDIISSSDTFEDEKQNCFNKTDHDIITPDGESNALMIDIDDPCTADIQVGCNIELSETAASNLYGKKLLIDCKQMDLSKVNSLKNEIESQLLDREEQYTIDEVTSLLDEGSLENIDLPDLLLKLCDTIMVPYQVSGDDSGFHQQNGSKSESRLSGNIVELVESICSDLEVVRSYESSTKEEKRARKKEKRRRKEEKERKRVVMETMLAKTKHKSVKSKKTKRKQSDSSDVTNTKKRKKQNFWTDEEELKLAKGVLGDGLFGKWAEIKVKYDLRNRTGVDIRRKWGNIVNHQSTGKFKKLERAVLQMEKGGLS